MKNRFRREPEKEKCPICGSESIRIEQVEKTGTAGGKLKTEVKAVKICSDCGWKSK